MDWWRETNWYAVQSRPFGEHLAAAQVGRLDLELFLPRVQQERLICGVHRTLTKALFPGYFFARFCPGVSLGAVRSTPGVLRVVGTPRLPIPVAPEIVQALRERTGDDGFVRFEPKSFRPGERVRIEEGPFAGWIGRVEREPDDRRRVLILLEALQPAQLLVEGDQLERLEAAG